MTAPKLQPPLYYGNFVQDKMKIDCKQSVAKHFVKRNLESYCHVWKQEVQGKKMKIKDT